MTRKVFRAFQHSAQHIPGQHMELNYGRNFWRFSSWIIRYLSLSFRIYVTEATDSVV
jgi:hypothetical protein